MSDTPHVPICQTWFAIGVQWLNAVLLMYFAVYFWLHRC